MDQGMAQNLVGMEVASDLDNLNTVYGLVTNYIEWMFLKSQNDKIEKHLDSLTFDEFEVATVESLKRIAGKIYALLSEDWFVEVISVNKLLLFHEYFVV